MNKDAQIKKLVDGFRKDQLSYDQYLEIANANDNLASHVAYNTFKGNIKLTGDDIRNFIPNLKKSSSEVNYGASATDQDAINDAKITKYCADHPKDPSCACINTATKLVQNAKSEQAAYEKKYADWLDLNKHNEDALTKYNADLAAYIKTLQDWSDVQIKYYNEDTPNYDSTKDYILREYYDGWGLWYRNKWTIKHTDTYINQLTGVWKTTNALPNTPPQPNYSPPSLAVPCCNNTIKGSSMTDIIQSCNQQILNNKDINGDKNSGGKKSGNKNSGDKNSGGKKSGDKNSGDKNSDNTTDTTSNNWLWLWIGLGSIVILFFIGIGIYLATRKTKKAVKAAPVKAPASVKAPATAQAPASVKATAQAPATATAQATAQAPASASHSTSHIM
jgi:cell division septation protein DedD